MVCLHDGVREACGEDGWEERRRENVGGGRGHGECEAGRGGWVGGTGGRNQIKICNQCSINNNKT